METVECETNKKIVPDPRQHGLTEDFIYVEQEWGSLFYKHMGKQTRKAAKNLCSRLSPGEETNSVHLPIPRFHEENEFYKTHFGSSGQNTDLDITLDEGLWLDVSYDVNEGLISVDGHSFIKYVRSFVTDEFDLESPNIRYEYTSVDDDLDDHHRWSDLITEEFVQIKYHDWINLTDMDQSEYFVTGDRGVFMKNNGEWEWINENEYGSKEFDAVCVYNIIPDECSECQGESFCRYTVSDKKETECDCQKMTKGEYCEIDSCSHCQNGGFCAGHDEIKCICPYPFHGDFCEGTNICGI